MRKNEKSEKFLKERRFYAVVPLIVTVFLVIGFYGFGGGRDSVATSDKKDSIGLQIELPDANLKDESAMNKMSYYDRAKMDSIRLKEMIENDPYYKDKMARESAIVNNSLTSVNSAPPSGLQYSTGTGPLDHNEAKIYNKLDQLNAALNTPGQVEPKARIQTTPALNGVTSSDIDRLENMMAAMGTQSEDPELRQLNDMLEKIMDIQNPQRAEEKLRVASGAKKGQVFPVVGTREEQIATLFDTRGISDDNSNYTGTFFSTDILRENLPDNKNVIPAVVNHTQTLLDGSIIKFRLTGDVFVSGIRIPKDNFLYGIGRLNGERLNVDINIIQFEQSFFPVNLTVYDLNGLPGIHITDAISRKVRQESTDRAMQGIGMTTFDGTLAAQAAGAGIESVKNLIGKRTRLVPFTVKAGHQVLLRDTNNKF